MLPLLPGAGFESSLLTAVLLGMLILLLFNETFGWAFTGVVVPGYLASIFLVRPAAGFIVSVEAVTTFAVVTGYERTVGRYGRSSPLFGRERFLALLVCSIAVRIGMESLLLPWVSRLAVDLGQPIDDGTGLYGVGLVIVPLAANVLWTGGLLRGGRQLGASVGLTYLLLSVLVVPHTNLSISDFELSFEDVATSFAASPRAYILLVASCYVATAAVRWFSWDVGGTLVPGLMAVAWLTPAKLVALFAEVALVLVVAVPFRRWGLLRGAHTSRRLASAFAILYLGKLAVASITDIGFPGLRVTDLFGLGYVLPAVLVERIWAYGNILRVMAPATLLSAIGALAGVGIGLSLSQMVPAPPPATRPEARTTDTARDLQSGILAGQVRVARRRPSMAAPVVEPLDLSAYRAVLTKHAAVGPRRTGILAMPRPDLQRLIAEAEQETEPLEISLLAERIAQMTGAAGCASDDRYAPIEFLRGALLPTVEAVWSVGPGEHALAAASVAARSAGFGLRTVVDTSGGSSNLVVLESSQVPVVALLRRTSAAPASTPATHPALFVLSPRVDAEPGTLELGLKLFDRLGADLALVSARRAEGFLLAALALADDEACATKASCGAVVVRGFSEMRPVATKMLWTPGSIALDGDVTPAWQRRIVERLGSDSTDLAQVGGRPEQAFALPRGAWRAASENGRLIHLWASASLRREARYAQRPARLPVNGLLVPWHATVRALAAETPTRARSHSECELDSLRALVVDFNERRDPAALQELAFRAKRLAARVALWNPPTGAPRNDPHVLILLRSTKATHVALISLAPLFYKGTQHASNYQAIDDYLQSDKAGLHLVVAREAQK